MAKKTLMEEIKDAKLSRKDMRTADIVGNYTDFAQGILDGSIVASEDGLTLNEVIEKARTIHNGTVASMLDLVNSPLKMWDETFVDLQLKSKHDLVTSLFIGVDFVLNTETDLYLEAKKQELTKPTESAIDELHSQVMQKRASLDKTDAELHSTVAVKEAINNAKANTTLKRR